MNSAGRIQAVIEGEFTDRRAIVLILSLYGARLTNCPLDQYYTDPDAYFKGQQAVRETFEPDVLFSPFVLPYMGAAYGSRTKVFENQPPNMFKPAINNARDFFSLEKPDVDSNVYLTYLRECVRKLVKEYGSTTPVGTFALSPMDLPSMVMGMETWLETVLFNQTLAKKIVEQVSLFFIEYTDKLFSDGASFVVLPLPFANLRIIPPKIAKEFAVPLLKDTFEQVKGPLVLHHVGASFLRSLEHLQGLPNVMGYYVGKEDSLIRARDIVGQKKVIIGNIDGPGLRKRGAEDIRRQTRDILEQMKDDPCFIIATSSPDIDPDTPEENILAIMDTVKRFSIEVGC